MFTIHLLALPLHSLFCPSLRRSLSTSAVFLLFSFSQLSSRFLRAAFALSQLPLTFLSASVSLALRDRLLQLRFFDFFFALTVNSLFSFHSQHSQTIFDARGLAVKVSNLGADGQPAVSKDGIATATSTYDALGNVTQIAFFGRDGQALLSRLGVAGMKVAYDPSGNLQEIAFMGTDGQLVTTRHIGAAGRIIRYDARGNIVESTFFDLHRQPVTGRLRNRSSFAKQRLEWDERGGALETYFGPDGKPIVTNGRVVTTRSVWDTRGYQVETAFFDEHKRPIRNVDGCAKLRIHV